MSYLTRHSFISSLCTLEKMFYMEWVHTLTCPLTKDFHSSPREESLRSQCVPQMHPLRQVDIAYCLWSQKRKQIL